MVVALWALDSRVPSLADHTVGHEPEARLQLLNQLCQQLPKSVCGQLVVCDDDITFLRGGLAELLGVAEAGAFGLAQPARALRSSVSHGITRVRPLTLARATTFVECGLVLVISHEGPTRTFPFPEECPGWAGDSSSSGPTFWP